MQLRDGHIAATGSLRDDLYLGITAPTALPSPAKDALFLAPNPNNGYFRWQLPAVGTAPARWEVFDAVGRRVADGTTLPEEKFYRESITLRNVGSGIYFLRIRQGDNLISRSVVIR